MAISDLVVKFGAAGSSPPALTVAEQVYAAMPIGFGAETQAKWRLNAVNANGISFVAYACIDSNDRISVEINGAYAEYPGSNIENADVDLQIIYKGVPQILWDGTTTYTYNHQRATWLRWQSEPLPWNTSHDYITQLIDEGVLLAHDSTNLLGQAKVTTQSVLPATALYKPFKAFSTFDSSLTIGDAPRHSPAGAERASLGPVHEWFAQLVSEVGQNNRPEWLTPTKKQILMDLAETAAQFRITSGLLDPGTGRLLDPSVKPHCTNHNANTWGLATGIEQPRPSPDNPRAPYYDNPHYNAYDNSHAQNKFSFYAYHLSKDPFHMLMVQGQAVASLAFPAADKGWRGADGKTLNLYDEQERGVWWGLQTAIHAWHVTPAGAMPKPFRDKAWFKLAIDNTFDFIRNRFINGTQPYYTGNARIACEFWGVVSHLGVNDLGEVLSSRFQEDYGTHVLMQAVLLGFTGARDVAEWHSRNLTRRIQLDGSMFLNDHQYWLDPAHSGSASYAMCPATGPFPYSTPAEFRAWYPRKQNYTDHFINYNDWPQQYGRDTQLFLGALNIAKECQARGLITVDMDLQEAEQEVYSRFQAPYPGYDLFAKQFYNYQGQVVPTTAPPDIYTGVGDMHFGKNAP